MALAFLRCIQGDVVFGIRPLSPALAYAYAHSTVGIRVDKLLSMPNNPLTTLQPVHHGALFAKYDGTSVDMRP